MKILIDNSGFKNRGDQLMIQSVVEQLSARYPSAQLLVKRDAFLQDPSYCISHKLYPLELSQSRIKTSRLYKSVVNFLLRGEWMVTPDDVDVILDCRGYHLADWRINGQRYVDYLKAYYKRFTKHGRRLVFLPQAFGPFENPYSRQAMQLVYSQADYIFAREQVSLNYLKELFPESQKIGISPDFTCLLSPQLHPSVILSEKDYVVIIPNAKMIEQGENGMDSRYIDYLTRITKYLRERGEKVVLLNHEGEKDERLLRTINANVDNKLPILTNLSGGDIKAVIGGAKLLLSGRFHGVVSGLTQGVPTLCTGWSHKYAELMKEHACEHNILQVDALPESITIISDALSNPVKYASKDNRNEAIRTDVYAMWERVFDIIDNK